MPTILELGGVKLDVRRKDIKNVHLSVYPPTGRVRISAPTHMSLDTLRLFAISKLGWIRTQQKKLREQDRETPREYIARESHFVWGQRTLLKVNESDDAPKVWLKHDKLYLRVRPGTNASRKREIVDEWYRGQVKEAVPALIAKWEPRVAIEVKRFYVRKMKTKWGSCNPQAQSIRFNTDLAKKPPDCLEYIVVHEMVHFLERTHNLRYIGLMDRFLPNWKFFREKLNSLPVSHESWLY